MIASSAPKMNMDWYIKNLNLGTYFNIQDIVAGRDDIPSKPAPDIYLAVARQLGVPNEECLVFEDIIPGIQAGKAAGMRVCAVEDAYSMDQMEEKKALADHYIKDFYEIMNAL